MQIKPEFWAGEAERLGYDLNDDAGQVYMAAAIVGGAIPWVQGSTPQERFLTTYYPVRDNFGNLCLECRGESGHTPQMYLDDIALYTKIINGANPAHSRPPIEPKAMDPAVNAILDRIVWEGTSNFQSREGLTIEAIVYHVTDDMSYGNVRGWFQNPASQASSHIVVDRDGTPYQFVRSSDAAWTNGVYNNPSDHIPWIRRALQDGGRFNQRTITIEHVGKPDVPFEPAQIDTSIALTRYFRAKYPSIPNHRGGMIRHADIDATGRTYCPGPNFPLDDIITAVGGDPTRFE
jgi:hypothetical protein